jgi:hypothetical protein
MLLNRTSHSVGLTASDGMRSRLPGFGRRQDVASDVDVSCGPSACDCVAVVSFEDSGEGELSLSTGPSVRGAIRTRFRLSVLSSVSSCSDPVGSVLRLFPVDAGCMVLILAGLVVSI